MNLRDRGTFPAMLKGTAIRLKASPLLLYLVSLVVFSACALTGPPIGFGPFDEPPLPMGGTAAIIQNIPIKARESSIDGMVVISTFIDTSGEVVEIHPLGSHSDLDAPVAEAIIRTPWKPARLEGEAVGVWVNIPVRFHSGEATVHYPLYDHPPVPVGGYEAILRQLRIPGIAQAAGLHGTVIVQAYVSAGGEVTMVAIQQGMPNTGLDEAAKNSINNTLFIPAMMNGVAVGTWIAIPVNFRLHSQFNSPRMR